MDWLADLLELNERGPSYSAMALRAVIVFAVLLLVARIGARRMFAKLNAMDAIIAIMMGSIASRAITGNSPFGPSLASVAVLIGLHWIFSFLAYHTDRLGLWLKGKALLLVEDGQPNEDALSRSKVTRRDIEECMRSEGMVGGIDEIHQAWLERDGSISIVPKSKDRSDREDA